MEQGHHEEHDEPEEQAVGQLSVSCRRLEFYLSPGAFHWLGPLEGHEASLGWTRGRRRSCRILPADWMFSFLHGLVIGWGRSRRMRSVHWRRTRGRRRSCRVLPADWMFAFCRGLTISWSRSRDMRGWRRGDGRWTGRRRRSCRVLAADWEFAFHRGLAIGRGCSRMGNWRGEDG